MNEEKPRQHETEPKGMTWGELEQKVRSASAANEDLPAATTKRVRVLSRFFHVLGGKPIAESDPVDPRFLTAVSRSKSATELKTYLRILLDNKEDAGFRFQDDRSGVQLLNNPRRDVSSTSDNLGKVTGFGDDLYEILADLVPEEAESAQQSIYTKLKEELEEIYQFKPFNENKAQRIARAFARIFANIPLEDQHLRMIVESENLLDMESRFSRQGMMIVTGRKNLGEEGFTVLKKALREMLAQ